MHKKTEKAIKTLIKDLALCPDNIANEKRAVEITRDNSTVLYIRPEVTGDISFQVGIDGVTVVQFSLTEIIAKRYARRRKAKRKPTVRSTSGVSAT